MTWVGKDFINKTKKKSNHKIYNKLVYIKKKNLYFTNQKKLLITHIINKGFVSRTYKKNPT